MGKGTAGKRGANAPEAHEANPHKLLSLDSSVPVLVTILANRITTSGSMVFRQRHGLGSTEWKVLSTIAIEPSVSGARISQLVGLDRAAVSRVLKIFVERRLVLVEQSDRHSNYQQVSLTAAGVALHDEAVETAFEREHTLLTPFSARERVQLVDFLRRLLDQSRALSDVARSERAEPAK